MHASTHHITCPECNKDLAEQSLLTQLRGQHGMELPSNTSIAPTALPLPVTFTLSFPLYRYICPCPVEGCSFSAQSWNLLHQHFVSHHPRDITSPNDRGQSTASDKSSDDLFSLMTAQNTSSNLKKQGIDINKVISERMAAAHISWEFMPEAFHLEFEATMEEEEDTGTPTLEADTPTIEYEGGLKESTLEVNMHHFYRGDPDEIREFALQDAVPYESSEGGTSSGEDSILHEILKWLEF
jgi:hypothetical protein